MNICVWSWKPTKTDEEVHRFRKHIGGFWGRGGRAKNNCQWIWDFFEEDKNVPQSGSGGGCPALRLFLHPLNCTLYRHEFYSIWIISQKPLFHWRGYKCRKEQMQGPASFPSAWIGWTRGVNRVEAYMIHYQLWLFIFSSPFPHDFLDEVFKLGGHIDIFIL